MLGLSAELTTAGWVTPGTCMGFRAGSLQSVPALCRRPSPGQTYNLLGVRAAVGEAWSWKELGRTGPGGVRGLAKYDGRTEEPGGDSSVTLWCPRPCGHKEEGGRAARG